MSDEAFMAWCESEKPCRYCRKKFFGPVCPCEREFAVAADARRSSIDAEEAARERTGTVNPIGQLPEPTFTASFDTEKSTSEGRTYRIGKCTRCGKTDHNRRNKRCPARRRT